jgi:membrane-bound lytic murein transglycosylase F
MVSYSLKKVLGICGALFLLLNSCKQAHADSLSNLDNKVILVDRDLEILEKSGKLKALIVNSNSSYFVHDGKPMGFEYELLTKLAGYLSLELELTVVSDTRSALSQLRNGSADIIASGLNSNAISKKHVVFTETLYETHQVLLQKKPDNRKDIDKKNLQNDLIKDRCELVGKTISVPLKNEYLDPLRTLEKEIGGKITIDTLPEDDPIDQIIQKVATGDIPYTIANHRTALRNASYLSDLSVNVPVTDKYPIAWAVRPNAPELLKAVNQWIEKEKTENAYKVVHDMYVNLTEKKGGGIKNDFYDLENNQISEYDYLIKLGAKKIGWDWRLLAAQIYQESQFKSKARSWAGAGGLMQIMPKTASQLGVKNRNNPIESIIGGTTYLQQLYNDFEDIKDPVQRIKFTMASYNCGYGHVRDAQKLALHKGFNKNKWDYNVEIMILSLSFPQNHKKEFVEYGYVRGRETYNYVQRIFKRYAHYKRFIKL